ncbi:MAG: Inward rectifier potassium channel Irk [Bacteroidetes bacterium]|nr:Inward rectifier potassium channel Irk [Bacteroidota bacterium]
MAIQQQPRRRKFEAIGNTGFSTSSNNTEGGRLTRKDGSVNLRKTGMPFWERISLYHSLLRMTRGKFLLCVFLFYSTLNVLFAGLYLLTGVENLRGVTPEGDGLNNFEQAFFFSSQTLTTVGYGHISPSGLAANVIASLESFIGILSFALVTGLLYGRFTRPRAYLVYSDNVIFAPFKDGMALMSRIATYKNNHLTDVEALVTIAMHITDDNGNKARRFYPLDLEIKKVNSLALSWTLVHPVDENSPLYGMTQDEIKEAEVEILYFIKGFDDHFSNIVQQRYSYVFSEIVFGAKFQPMFRRSDDNMSTVLELDKINLFEPVKLPQFEKSTINV